VNSMHALGYAGSLSVCTTYHVIQCSVRLYKCSICVYRCLYCTVQCLKRSSVCVYRCLEYTGQTQHVLGQQARPALLGKKSRKVNTLIGISTLLTAVSLLFFLTCSLPAVLLLLLSGLHPPSIQSFAPLLSLCLYSISFQAVMLLLFSGLHPSIHAFVLLLFFLLASSQHPSFCAPVIFRLAFS
jgi:hypothetical protein